jgi:hypothetical protein
VGVGVGVGGGGVAPFRYTDQQKKRETFDASNQPPHPKNKNHWNYIICQQ